MPEKMKSVRRLSLSEDFAVHQNEPIPNVPQCGARIKVCYAGACYTDRQAKETEDLSRRKGLRLPAIHNTSLFPGLEVSGIIETLCNKVEGDNLKQGDRVIVFPDDDVIRETESGFSEYLIVKNPENLIPLPPSLSLEMAALLPCGALRAYAAVQRAKPIVQDKLNKNAKTNLLIVGAGGLGLWTLKLVQHFIANTCSGKLRVTIADTSIEKLMTAKDQGCFDVIHWCDTIHEEYIVDRTNNVCHGGVDVAIDFVSSLRTVKRTMRVLKEEGVILVGGNSKFEVQFCLNSLAEKNQSILGVHKGTRKQLQELVETFAEGKMTPPCYSVFPVEEANNVFDKLNQCQISGRAVLQVCAEEDS